MKKVFALSIGLLLLASCEQDTIVSETEGINVDQSSLTRGAKVDVCHNGRIINVSVNALGGHQGHGDAIDMDGDGYFDIENDCSDTDCDDTNAEVNENCVGDLRDGGVVFWVDSTGLHGLVCAFSDYESRVAWGCFGTDLPSVPNVQTFPLPSGLGAEIGDGITNTNGILSATDCPEAPAALAARSYGPEWFLPSINELNEMYVNKADLEAVPGFAPFEGVYWSSTEHSRFQAWWQFFNVGFQRTTLKLSPVYVRAVRAF